MTSDEKLWPNRKMQKISSLIMHFLLHLHKCLLFFLFFFWFLLVGPVELDIYLDQKKIVINSVKIEDAGILTSLQGQFSKTALS